MKKYLVILALIFVLASCQKAPEPSLVCQPPYMMKGTDCCLDEDSNSICDSDEVIEEEEPASPETENASEDIPAEAEPVETEMPEACISSIEGLECIKKEISPSTIRFSIKNSLDEDIIVMAIKSGCGDERVLDLGLQPIEADERIIPTETFVVQLSDCFNGEADEYFNTTVTIYYEDTGTGLGEQAEIDILGRISNPDLVVLY